MIEKLQSKQSYRQPYLPANARPMCRENNSTFVDNNPTIIGLLPNVVFSLCASLTENLIMWCSNQMFLFLCRLYTCSSQCKRYRFQVFLVISLFIYQITVQISPGKVRGIRKISAPVRIEVKRIRDCTIFCNQLRVHNITNRLAVVRQFKTEFVCFFRQFE